MDLNSKKRIPMNIDFTPRAETLLAGQTGVHPYGAERLPEEVPNIGDTIRLRLAPSGKVLDFVCTTRLWDFSQTGKQQVTLTLDFE